MKKVMKIGILGTRGVPNAYGGFEQFAEYLSVYLVKAGHDVYVYNSHSHPYQESVWNGVNLIHKNDPEDKIGTVGQFIYDLNCILDSRKRSFDIVLQLGYTSNSIWGWLLPNSSVIVTNMDGLEWKRSKYSKPVRYFLKIAEYLGTKWSDHLISDSIGIKNYLMDNYNKKSTFIAYGATVFKKPNVEVLKKYEVAKYNYSMLIARMEPENNVEVILDAINECSKETFIVVGGVENTFGSYLVDKYKGNKSIRFIGGVYEIEHLNNLRYYSRVYFHGHSVGGTNPSLLEAMASSTLIFANDNIFNKAILGEDAYYFTNKTDIKNIFLDLSKDENKHKVEANLLKIQEQYDWDLINKQYEDLLIRCLKSLG